MSRVPFVVVLGATGTGKSKLAILIAKKFNGEIISADSIQVYKGLDIASNKVTQKERAEVPHHMLDICGPLDRFSAPDYRNRTLPIIEDILKRNKLPVLVGGTNYYIESILWYNLFVPSEENTELVLNRRQVLNNPTEINRWKTYKASVMPLQKNNERLEEEINDDSLLTEIKVDSVTIEDINSSINEIERLQVRFANMTQDIGNCIKISFSLYMRTFYKIPNVRDKNEPLGYDEAQIDSSQYSMLESKFTNFVDVETTIMNYYVCFALKQILLKLDHPLFRELNSDGDHVNCLPEDFNNFWNKKIVFRVLNREPFEVCDFNSCVDQVRNMCSFRENVISTCYRALNKIIENVVDMSKVRVNRLRLIRVIDDEIMFDYSNEELCAELKLFNADALKCFHPNNRRKVIRAIQIYFGTGKTYTEMIDEQHQMEGACAVSPAMRFPDTCLLWLCCDQVVLDNRLDKRVDEMLNSGLINELEAFHKLYNLERLKYNREVDYTKGIFQSIGLKEFHSYLMLEDEQKSSMTGKKMFQRGVKSLKMATKKYSKFQFRTILNRFIRIPDIKKMPPIFELDCTDTEKWEENVESKALSIVEEYLKGKDLYSLTYSPMDLEEPHPDRFQDGEYRCEICQRLFIGLYQWRIHYASKGHRKQLYKLKLKEFHKKIDKLKKPQKTENINVDDEEEEEILKLLLH